MLVGNDYGNEVFAGRYDAFTGLTLLGNGKGSFDVMPSAESGFYAAGDAKGLVKLYRAGGEEVFVVSQNRDSLCVFGRSSSAPVEILSIDPLETSADLIYSDGKTQRIELYYGSGYLSQSSRKLRVPKGIKEIVIYNSKGKSRKIEPVKS